MLANIPVDESALEKRVGEFRAQQGRVSRDTTYDEGFISTLIDSRRAQDREITRMRDYWLCIHGLTFSGFMDGYACGEPLEEGTCDVGKEHASGVAADKLAVCKWMAAKAGRCTCFAMILREQGEMCDHELALQELEDGDDPAADLTQPGQGG